MYDQILFAKIGWAELYTGDNVDAHTSDKSWCERHNFLKVGTSCYGYITPANRRLPNPKGDRTNWLIVFVAPWKVDGPIVPVGFYLNAKLEPEYLKRPDGLPDRLRKKNVYCVSTLETNAVLIPSDERLQYALPSEVTAYFRRTFCYARGNNIDKTQRWRNILAETAERVVGNPR